MSLPSHDFVGTVLQDRYEILSLVGEGGFGRVYRARQRRTGQEVAVKILKPRWAEDGTQMARFRRELDLCARLYHPNIVRLLDTGRTDTGQLYIVFDLVPGRVLAEVLAEEGPLSAREAVHLMGQVLDALQCAHRRGVIHRDLKPHNIMLATTGARRNALVLDFGLGTLSEEARREDHTSLTLSQEMMGTPAYAAPELLLGEEASARADLYAWGLIFLECITGRRAVRGASLQEVLHQQLGPTPIPLPESIQGHRLGLLLERVLAKRAASRDVPVTELLRALEDWPLHEEQRSGWTPTPSATEPGGASVPSSVPSEIGRRQVTALCVGLTLAGTRALPLEAPLEAPLYDEEDLDRLLLAQREACLSLARRYKVRVCSMLGARVLLCLGYPQAREDDGRRAALLALELAAALERRAAELAPQGLELTFRLGLHTGLVLGPGGSGPFGTTLDVAAQLEALAPPCTILASEATARLLHPHFSLEPAGTYQLPGPGRPLAALRLGAPLEADRSLALTSRSGLPLYGRTQELELLSNRWQLATRGQGQAVLVVGEPGMGKSRLVRELSLQLRGTDHLRLVCRCTPELRNSTLRPVVELLERLLSRPQEASGAHKAQRLQDLLERLRLPLADTLPMLAALLGLPPPPAHGPPPTPRLKEATLEALLLLLFALAEHQPMLLIVEDLQWADPTTLELLTRLVGDVPATRLCALLTARPEFTPPWSNAQTLQVRLGRLEARHVEQMVQSLTGGRPLPAEALARVVQRADGIPLFVEELTRAGLEPQAEPSGGPRLSRPLQPSVPSTLRDLLMARLDALGPALETAQLAAVLGREFPDELLRCLFPRTHEELQQHLGLLGAADLLHRRRSARQSTWFFKQALVRDTAYESLPKPARRQVHARIAELLEQRFAELAEQRPELLALHHAAAEHKPQALLHARRAVSAALRRAAWPEALAQASEALGWLEAVEDRRERAQHELELSNLLLLTLLATHGWEDEAVQARLERSLQLVALLGAGPSTLPHLWELLLSHRVRGHLQLTRQLAERLVEQASGDVDQQVTVLPLLGGCLVAEGQLTRAREALERALCLYAPERHGLLAMQGFGLDARAAAAALLAEVLWCLGSPAQGMEYARLALTAALQSKHLLSHALACIQLATLHQLCSQREALLTLATGTGPVGLEQAPAPARAHLGFLQGWAAASLEAMSQHLNALGQLHFGLGLSYFHALLAEVESAQGRHLEALARLESALLGAHQTGELQYLSELLRLRGVCLEQSGAQAEAAERSLREARECARAQGALLFELRATLGLVRLLARQGRAHEVLPALAALADRLGERAPVPEVRQARALLGEHLLAE